MKVIVASGWLMASMLPGIVLAEDAGWRTVQGKDLQSLFSDHELSDGVHYTNQFRRDGSIAAATVSEQDGVNDDNRGYAKQMGELSRRAVLRCSPLKGLPPELYDGGWADFDMGFIPRQLG